MSVRGGGPSFVTFLRVELAGAWRLRHFVTLMGLSLMGAVVAFWLPRFPESIFWFFVRVLHLRDWSEIVVV